MVHRVRFAWVQRPFIFRFTACGFLAATLIAFLIPSRYISTARLMPPDQTSSGLATMAAALTGKGGDLTQGLGSVAGDLLDLKSTSDVFVGILGSRTTEDKLIQQFNLQKVYHDRHIEDAREDLEDHTRISVDRKSQIITIQVIDKDPRRAAAMAEAYVGELNTLVSQLSTSSARRERIFLEGRLQTVKRDLEAAEKSFSQFASKNTAIDVPAQGRAMVEAAAVLQGQLIAAESELQGLKQIYSDNNVRVRSLAARVNELQSQLDKIGGKGEGADASAPDDGSMYPSIRKLPLLGVPYADLYRETRVQEAVFATLTQEYELAKVQEAKEIPTVKVLDSPDIPGKRAFPPRLAISVFGTMLAFITAIAWVYGDRLWQQTPVEDPRKLFAHEVFYTIKLRLPWISQNGSGKRLAEIAQNSQQNEKRAQEKP
jgi:capsule polysaccharide export protein KpsE/RkpR